MKKETENKEPEWRHITKAGQKKSSSSWSNALWGIPRQPPKIALPEEIKTLKMYKIPVNYLVTTYVYISAKNLDEAIEKGMGVEPPELAMVDNTAHETTILHEVMYGEAQELDENG